MWQNRIETYEQAAAYLAAVSRSGVILGLESMRRLAAELGDPQNRLRFIHIAGTNGKGSTLCFLSSILRCGGYRVGRYSSPAVFTELEKFQVGKRTISRADYVRILEQVRQAAERLEQKGFPYPTVFELETALAFWYFWEKGCDVAVLETGLGGLLDATNVITTTAAAALTRVGRDHMGMLGDTLAAIGEQKAGIIKEGCKAVSLRQEPEVFRVIEKASRERHAALTLTDPAAVKKIRRSLRGQRFTYGGYEDLEIKMPGTYQIENAALAVDTVKVLREEFPVTERALRRGLLEADWKGRFTILARRPCFIIDGAHNEDGAKKLRECLSIYFTNKKIITIIGVLKDKDYETVIARIAPLTAAAITVAAPGNRRAMPAIELAEAVRPYQPNVTAADSLQEAVEMSYLLAGREDVILAFGSLSHLGGIAAAVADRDKIRRDSHGR